MKRRSQRKSQLAALIFFVLIAAGGIALAATGNWENPFAAFTSSTREGGPGGEKGEGFAPPETASGTNNAPMERANMGERSGGQGESGVTWSQFGHVLYNIWFLFAAAGVVMLISLPIRLIRKEMRRRYYSVSRSALQG